MNWECLIVGIVGCIIGAVVIAIVTCVISSRETEQEKQCYHRKETKNGNEV